ncbi:MAG: hypothetical protein ABL901_07020 [Hyphomicrobiaceae bacterium]
MLVRSFVISALAAGSALLAGCSDTSSVFGNNSANLTTASVAPVSAAKVDPACTALTTQIDTLRKEGIAEKIEKASLKKYKMTTADLAKADQLNKSNTDFQTKCTTYKPSVAAVAAPAVPVKAAAAPKAVAAANETVASAAPAKQ